MPEPILSQRTPRVLVAPNAFKGTLTAAQAAAAMHAGVRRVLPDALVTLVPLADGGDGTVDAFVAAGFERVSVTVHGPLGEPVPASFAHRGTDAVVELACCCGLALLAPGVTDPMGARTRGLGEAMLAALDAGATDLLVGLGGSASTDGGAGALAALGARVLDRDGEPVPPGGGGLGRVDRLDLSGLDPRLRRVTVTLAVDVRSPLVGPEGAAAVFGPQKGATPDQVAVLDDALRSWARVLEAATGHAVADRPGAGAAGGTAAGLMAALDADTRPGVDVVMALIDLPGRLADADLVLTGEGRIDAQTALGKGVGVIAQRCSAAGVPVAAVAGVVDLDDAALRSLALTDWAACAPDDGRDPGERVADATAEVVGRWLARSAAS